MTTRGDFKWTTSSPSSIPGDHLFDRTPELRKVRREINSLTTYLTSRLQEIQRREAQRRELGIPDTQLRYLVEHRTDVEEALQHAKEMHQYFIDLLAANERLMALDAEEAEG